MRITVVVLLVLGAVVVGAIIYFSRFSPTARRAEAQDQAMLAAFTPDPDNRTSVSVRGWTKPELDKITADFVQSYGMPGNLAHVAVQADGGCAITFPNDITPKLLYFLVNYITYPKGFDIKGRTISATAHVVLSPAFGIPDPALAGKHATVYVPANDSDYDLVYAKVEDGRAYKISFTDLIWQEVSDPRLPAGLR